MKMPYKRAQLRVHAINGELFWTLLLCLFFLGVQKHYGWEVDRDPGPRWRGALLYLLSRWPTASDMLQWQEDQGKREVSRFFRSFFLLLQDCLCPCNHQVWNVERAMLLRVFEEEHEEQVNHCQFTNTARRLLLATCSNDKFLNVKVWMLLYKIKYL